MPLDEALALICHFADEDVDPHMVIAELDQLASTMSATNAVDLIAELFGPLVSLGTHLSMTTQVTH